ncbi:class I SAM-dependent methyltransferase [Ornithinimicrobium avium]|uniref:Methyltransferase domain-containing protein n=1 Tax=Ornithinimicrobium avium TaxID=2283195 RepID=A0A345NL92_9MICO|nr:methyltransferase [Ornithinimicrobium avium]AXH95800.1 methyltransferase domain-containing protein [Ornithinimicrobium avium]
MPEDHYFTAHPASDGELRRVPVRLAGREVEVVTAGGVFSPGGLDRGTRVLLAEVPPPPAEGAFLDLGCGWGPLALTLALQSPEATVQAVDVNERALDLCRRNARTLGCTRLVASTPDEVDPDTGYDLIWSNPPIRVGKAVLHGMLTTWLRRLAAGGTAYLVVQKNLGGDSLQAWLARTLPDLMDPVTVAREATSKGFRVLRVTRA